MERKYYVYKITSPSKKIYVGSTSNLKLRIKKYRTADCKPQTKLYNSLKKYGFNNHKFEIITECNMDIMFKLESYYGQLYNSIGENGLNLRLPSMDDKFTPMDKDVKRRISESQKGANSKRLGIPSWNKGKKYIGDTSIFAHNTGKKLTEEQKKQRSIDIKKVRSTIESRLKTSIQSKGGKNANAKKVIQRSTGRIFGSKSEAAEFANINEHTLGHYLRGRFKNITDFEYLNK